MERQRKHVVVVGGGIIGVSFAYYASQLAASSPESPQLSITLVEAETIACAASGKAGGFLARSWPSGASSTLATLSWEMHEAAVASFPPGVRESVGYRKIRTVMAALGRDGDVVRDGEEMERVLGAGDAGWMDGDGIAEVEVADEGEGTAQITPYPYVMALLEAARGVDGVEIEVREGTRVVGFHPKGEGKGVGGVVVEGGEVVEGDDVVIAMGPWSGMVNQWLSELEGGGDDVDVDVDVDGEAAYSWVVSGPRVLSTAVFLDEGTEVYPRPDGSVYVCSGNVPWFPLPATQAEVVVDAEQIGELKKTMARFAPTLFADAETLVEQACYLPIRRGEDQTPLIGRLYGENVWIAAGHSVWGVLMSPATGLGLAQLVLGVGVGEGGVDVAAFAP